MKKDIVPKRNKIEKKTNIKAKEKTRSSFLKNSRKNKTGNSSKSSSPMFKQSSSQDKKSLMKKRPKDERTNLKPNKYSVTPNFNISL